MPMLIWLPAIVMAGMYAAMSDEFLKWQRAYIEAGERSDA